MADDHKGDEFEAIASTRVRTVPCRGEELEIRPLRVGQLPAFARHARPLVDAFNGEIDSDAFSLDTVVSLIENHGDQMIDAVAVAVAKPREWVADTDPDEFLELASAVLATNLDFFVRRLLPKSTGNVDAIAALLRGIAGSGRTRSSSSSETATH